MLASSPILHKNIARPLYQQNHYPPTMNILDLPSKSTSFDHFQSQFNNLTISSHSPPAFSSDVSSAYTSPNASPKATCSLGPPFSMSYNTYPSSNNLDFDDGPLVIDTFSPKPLMHDLSPTSSASSDLDSHFSSPRFSFEAFVHTRSRVVRTLGGQRPVPISLWTMREECDGRRPDSIWAVFKTHEEAASALSLSGPALSVTTAIENDLEPFHKLRRFVLDAPAQPGLHRMRLSTLERRNSARGASAAAATATTPAPNHPEPLISSIRVVPTPYQFSTKSSDPASGFSATAALHFVQPPTQASALTAPGPAPAASPAGIPLARARTSGQVRASSADTFWPGLRRGRQNAEGNGDSISAAVQAERIALLTSVLAQTQAHAAVPQASLQVPRSHSLTPPQHRRAFIDVSPPQTQLQSHAPVHRSHSHYDLGAQYSNREASPIYQTSGTRQRQSSPLYSTGPDFRSLPVHAPAPLLPSFLQDMVQSPALSPTSTSSADLSFEEYDDMLPTKTSFPRTHSSDDALVDSPIGNIWRLDGEESKSLSAFALPNRQDLIGSGKRNSREGLRLQVITS
ncbi:hypothetical protein DXG01_004481 [Tephrocybe rancida]|nr:hypothetical protein DXG01_004481 [Tephrocybe rancida]